MKTFYSRSFQFDLTLHVSPSLPSLLSCISTKICIISGFMHAYIFPVVLKNLIQTQTKRDTFLTKNCGILSFYMYCYQFIAHFSTHILKESRVVATKFKLLITNSCNSQCVPADTYIIYSLLNFVSDRI